MFKSKFLLRIIFFYCSNICVNASLDKIDPGLMKKLNSGEKVNVLVTFTNGIRTIVETLKIQEKRNVGTIDRGAQIKTFVDALKQNADSSQQSLENGLSTRKGGGGFKYFRKYWSSNKMFIKEADLNTIKMVADDPKVARIWREPILKIPSIKAVPVDFEKEKLKTKARPDYCAKIGDWQDGSCCPRWTFKRLGINEAWAELGGNQGKDVVIATIDTGVYHKHAQLRENWRGPYGWYDGVNGTLEPFDGATHGTLVTSIAVGKTVGVAPGATWMTCRGCGDLDKPGNECSPEHILNCVQWLLCPTLADGSKPDCSKAPHVLSFSVAGERDTDPYAEDFLVLQMAGIIPVAGVGNDGPKRNCGTSLAPANQPWVIGVGGTEWCEVQWGGSSIGPTPDGRIKPDVMAPADFIIAAYPWPDDDTFLQPGGGTSSATPQVAGLVALLYVRNPHLTFEQAYKLLTENTYKDIVVEDNVLEGCPGNDTIFPNNYIGYGRIDVLKTIQAQTAELGAQKALGVQKAGYVYINSNK